MNIVKFLIGLLVTVVSAATLRMIETTINADQEVIIGAFRIPEENIQTALIILGVLIITGIFIMVSGLQLFTKNDRSSYTSSTQKQPVTPQKTHAPTRTSTAKKATTANQKNKPRSEDEGDFLTSAAVGAAASSAAIGALVGGSLIGGIVGESFSDDDDSQDNDYDSDNETFDMD